jgi:hypothetical protein
MTLFEMAPLPDDLTYRILIEAIARRKSTSDDGGEEEEREEEKEKEVESSLSAPNTAALVYATAIRDDASQFDPFQTHKRRSKSSSSSPSSEDSHGEDAVTSSIETALLRAMTSGGDGLWLPYSTNSDQGAGGRAGSGRSAVSLDVSNKLGENQKSKSDVAGAYSMIDLHHHSEAAAAAAFRYCLARIAAAALSKGVAALRSRGGRSNRDRASKAAVVEAALWSAEEAVLGDGSGLLVVTGHGKQRQRGGEGGEGSGSGSGSRSRSASHEGAKLPTAMRRLCRASGIEYRDIHGNEGALLLPPHSLLAVVAAFAEEWWDTTTEEEQHCLLSTTADDDNKGEQGGSVSSSEEDYLFAVLGARARAEREAALLSLLRE